MEAYPNLTIILQKTEGFRNLFYLRTPSEIGKYTYDPTLSYSENIPIKLESNVADYFLIMMLMEWIWLTIFKKRSLNFSDMVCSTIMGQSSLVMKIISFDTLYRHPLLLYVYDNYRLLDFRAEFFQSWTGFIYAALVIEFWYYIHHRISHEINFFWSFHSVHHMSQQYLLTTALRQSAWHGLISFMEINVCTLAGIPPPQIALHQSLNLLYQFWIHTNMIYKLPRPIEFIFNTPSHHRMHHGRNRDCIDCNYGGLLIIYDRIFETFREETGFEQCLVINGRDRGSYQYGTTIIEDKTNYKPKTETISYGLVTNINTYGFMKIQHEKCVKNFTDFYTTFKNESLMTALRQFYYGPGYDLDQDLGSENRLGERHLIPNPEIPEEIFEPSYEGRSKILVLLTAVLMTFYNDNLLKATNDQNFSIETGYLWSWWVFSFFFFLSFFFLTKLLFHL